MDRLYWVTNGLFYFWISFLYLWYQRFPHFEQQVLWSGTIDIIVVVFLINKIGYIESALGILLYAYIAVLSILAPGRLAIYFAAIASCLLLAISIAAYVHGNQNDLSGFFSTGIYGAGFFATALTAWYLASLIRSSEHLAQDRAKELASMHRLNEYIVERLQYGVIYVDSNRQIKVINKAARQFLNLAFQQNHSTLEEVSLPLYKKYLQFLSQKQANEQSAQATIDKPYLQVHFFSASDAEKTAVLIIIDDMMNIAQQAQQLKLASLGRFSASIAHELRNPLGAISHAIQLLGEEEYLNEEDSRLKQLILKNCERMNQVIKNVLQMSRRQQSSPEAIDLTSFLQQFKHEFCLINQCNITINLPLNKARKVVFDKSQLEQVLIILCDNAMQHGRDSTGEVNITIAVEEHVRHMLLTLCDTGPGITKEIRNNIFDPFFSTLRSGNGMGLFIAKDLCEINQARLNFVESKQGCCFSINFNYGNEIKL
ncbi:His kinase A phosphoacceptor domain/histidine kinase-, DNA gyrase B-, and HSP90-like ATPase [Legionella oakridgensis ATCC 33761 = DSM 21215]|uniref:histidine kinase n=1 Tax=Legionella oakridgensis ATCC 33761 = DSM 21215 TaxID=1268635 RepID=W0BE53_9GAMM|nr:HAMP domain-containing sensor histidine kinase [Legionella oakridgensis]AHE66986.1 His kinase A phosphoacceptor domain/histidine kinase-, DNA gyrase B-, and HSP90-like ATPase [Legionella oakridgensis ATCC 33761 = DSM 21215]